MNFAFDPESAGRFITSPTGKAISRLPQGLSLLDSALNFSRVRNTPYALSLAMVTLSWVFNRKLGYADVLVIMFLITVISGLSAPRSSTAVLKANRDREAKMLEVPVAIHSINSKFLHRGSHPDLTPREIYLFGVADIVEPGPEGMTVVVTDPVNPTWKARCEVSKKNLQPGVRIGSMVRVRGMADFSAHDVGLVLRSCEITLE